MQEADYRRQGKVYVFDAFAPVTGATFTLAYPNRPIVTWVDFLRTADGWMTDEVSRVYTILDNQSTHRAVDVLVQRLTHLSGVSEPDRAIVESAAVTTAEGPPFRHVG